MKSASMLAVCAALGAALSVAATDRAEAATFVSRSPVRSVTFYYAASDWWGRKFYVPMTYTWQGTAVITYTRYGSAVNVQKIDQSVVMYRVAQSGNPCGIAMNVSTAVTSPSACYNPFYPTSGGSYIWSPNDMLRGGVCYPNIWPRNPTFTVTARSVATGGNLGSGTLTWSFTLP